MTGKARRLHAAATALRQAGPAANNDHFAADADTMPRIDSARRLLGAALSNCEGLCRFVSDVQQARAVLSTDQVHAVLNSLHGAQASADLDELRVLQARMSGANMSCTIETSTQVLSRLLQAEAHHVQQAFHCLRGKSQQEPPSLAAGPARQFLH